MEQHGLEKTSFQAPAAGSRVRPWLGVWGALCTTLIGLGLARFAYAPIIPALIAAHWFTPAQAAYGGAANIAGYLAGALAARPSAARLGTRHTLRACMVLTTASLFACMAQAGVAWFLGWRFMSGLGGAGLIVLAAPGILPLVPAKHAGRASGLIFSGIGLGIVGAGALLPVVLRGGLPAAWAMLGTASLLLSCIAWWALPPDPQAMTAGQVRPSLSPALRMLNVAYAISAMGQVPAMLFLADYVARGLGLGVAAGAAAWTAFGVGALAGPLACGALADRLGHVSALRWLWVAQIAAGAALTAAAASGQGGLLAIGLAGAVIGAGIPGLVTLVFGRSQVLAGPSLAIRRHAWGHATLAFAAGQTVAAYAVSHLFGLYQRYDLLFGLGAACMVAAIGTGEVSAAAGRGHEASR